MCFCVCVTVHVLSGTPSKMEDFVLIVDGSLYPKYKMFCNKVEIWMLNDRRGSAREYNGNSQDGVRDGDKEKISIR